VVVNDPTVRRMLERRRLSKETEASYLKGIRNFCEYLGGVKPGEALKRVKAAKNKKLLELFEGWFIWLRDSVSPKTAYNWFGGVKVWLEENNLDLEAYSRKLRRGLLKYVGKPEKLLKRDIISKEDIVKMLQHAGIREKALITLLASSGLRIKKSALQLKLKHFKDDLWDESLPCYALEIPEELAKAPDGEEEPHITFISAECARYLREYLDWRKRNGETITPESYLFTVKESFFVQDAFTNPKPITYKGILHIWDELCKEAAIDRKPVELKAHAVYKRPDGVKTVRLHRYNVRIHSLRKYFKTSCSLHGVDRMAAEAMMGHSLRSFGIESVYDYCASNLDFLREQYMKALPAFTFLAELPALPTINGEARKRVEELQAILAEKELEIQALRSKLQKLEAMGAKMEKLEAYLTEDVLEALKKLAKKQKK
jgi:integrase